MTLPNMSTHRSVIFWVAVLALATLATPTFAATITANPSQVGFAYQQGTPGPNPQPVTISSSAAGPVSVTAVTIGPVTGPVSAQPFVWNIGPSNVVNIGISTSVLNTLLNIPAAVGTYTATLTVSVGSDSVGIPLSLGVNQGTGSSTVTPSPASLAFSTTVGGFASAQFLTLTSPTPITFTALASTTTGANWLFVSPNSGTTPATLTVQVNSAGLTNGTYNGSINVTPSSGGALTVPVSFSVGTGSSGLSVTPTVLQFSS